MRRSRQSRKDAPRALSRRSTWILLGVILVGAAVIRGAYLKELLAEPEFLTPIADAAFHDYWAKGLANGEWTPPPNEADPRIREVPYLRPPGYPYFLGWIYELFGTGPSPARIAQMLLGVLNCFLAFRLGRALFGPAAGLVTAAFCAFSWVLIYFEGELQAEFLIQTAALSLLLLMNRWSQTSSRPVAFAAGVAAGILAVIRANALLFLPVAILWMVRAWRQEGRDGRPIASAALFALGAMLAIAPVTARNWVIAKEFTPISCNGAVNLYIGNNETSNGMTAKIPDLTDLTGLGGWSWFSYDRVVQGIANHVGREMSYGDVSKFFRDRAVDYIRNHPADFVRLTLRKAALFWGPDEISNNKAIRFEKEGSGVLRPLPGFPLFLTLAVLGLIWIAIDARGGRKFPPGVALVGAFVVTYFASFVLFLAAARFRVPLMPLLFLFGAYALVRFFETVTARSWARVAAMGAVGVGIFLASRVSTVEANVDREWWHTDRGVSLAQAGLNEAAVREFRDALEVNPGFVDARDHLSRSLVQLSRWDEAIVELQELAKHRGHRFDFHLRLGEALLHEGRYPEAVTALTSAVRVNENNAFAHFQLGRALLEVGQYEPALEAFYSSLSIEPGQVLAHVNIAVTLGKMKRYDEAVLEFGRALELDPFVKETHLQLGNLHAERGDHDKAIENYVEAVRVDTKYFEGFIQLGNALNEVGRYGDASDAYRRAIQLDERSALARFNLAGSLANGGQLEAAITTIREALEIDPSFGPAQERLRTLEDYRKTLQTGPGASSG